MAALFSFPAQSGEWENFKDLKQAMVRSSARKDFTLPAWVSNLDYQRSAQFYDLSALKKTEKRDDPPLPVPSPPSSPVNLDDASTSHGHMGDGVANR